MTPYKRKRNWRDLTPEIEHERHLRRVAELELQRYEREQRRLHATAAGVSRSIREMPTKTTHYINLP